MGHGLISHTPFCLDWSLLTAESCASGYSDVIYLEGFQLK
jgi:hypothetical protein